MQVLIAFSLKRRFLNASTLLLNVLLALIITAAFFADEIVNFINPSLFDEQKVYLQVDEVVSEALMQMEMEGIVFETTDKSAAEIIEEDAKAYVLTHEENYQLITKYPIDETTQLLFNEILTSVHQNLALSEVLQEEALAYSQIQIQVENEAMQKDVDVDPNKQNLISLHLFLIHQSLFSFPLSSYI